MARCAFQYFQMAIVVPMLTGEISIIGTQIYYPFLSIGELTTTRKEYLDKQHELKRLKYYRTLYISKKIMRVKSARKYVDCTGFPNYSLGFLIS